MFIGIFDIYITYACGWVAGLGGEKLRRHVGIGGLPYIRLIGSGDFIVNHVLVGVKITVFGFIVSDSQYKRFVIGDLVKRSIIGSVVKHTADVILGAVGVFLYRY